MDADHANRVRGRMRVSELWRPLPWWERVVYTLAVLLLSLAILITVVSEYLPAGWHGELHWTLNTWLPVITSFLLTASFPFLVAACVLAMRRWRPEYWRLFRQMWSLRLMLVGTSVLFAFSGWSAVIELATPADQIPPTLPAFLAGPAYAAGGLALVGMVFAAPEAIMRKSRAERRQL